PNDLKAIHCIRKSAPLVSFSEANESTTLVLRQHPLQTGMNAGSLFTTSFSSLRLYLPKNNNPVPWETTFHRHLGFAVFALQHLAFRLQEILSIKQANHGLYQFRNPDPV
ncbi:hypothetical protein, partial [Comamonas testosteroni]|uniref:hypothetical protein n=1 Tax=Comamonas testosteroni TaxID=285 RepID=UPI001C3FB5B1